MKSIAECGASLVKIISGGQTGVDRAALDVALELGLPCGGWCPRGRRAEDGVIAERYPLTETRSARYAARTARNVRAGDGTLVLTRGQPSGGTALTIAVARRYEKPCLVVDLAQEVDMVELCHWLRDQRIAILNVAGPRESQSPGIGMAAAALLRRLLRDAC